MVYMTYVYEYIPWPVFEVCKFHISCVGHLLLFHTNVYHGSKQLQILFKK